MVDIATDLAHVLQKRDRRNPLTMRCYQCSMSRWENDIKLVKPRALEIQRAKAGNQRSVNSYFDVLEKVITK